MTIQSLQILLNDSDINEIMWNGYDKAFLEFNGTLRPFPFPIKSAHEFEELLSKLSKLDNTVNWSDVSFDGMLPDGSRFHVTLPPLSPHEATLTIRKFSRRHRRLSDLTRTGFIKKETCHVS